jgi:hypothetical protein
MNSAFPDVLGVPGLSSQRLGSCVGFGTRDAVLGLKCIVHSRNLCELVTHVTGFVDLYRGKPIECGMRSAEWSAPQPERFRQGGIAAL